MIGTRSAQTAWDFLTRDVTLFGGIQSPFLSWAGGIGIFVFFLWHLIRFFRHVSYARSAYLRLWPTVSSLAEGRRQGDQEWLTVKAFADSQASRQTNLRPDRIDLDDVHKLDAAMRQEPLFQRAWMQFRKTYVLERTSWFIEPRVFSTKPAGEYFPSEEVLAGRLNLSFYHQLPSLMTGIGLLFTFLAILIGLSRLHAEGAQIVGIQGLINGLAGKFLTSVIGLVCANVFVMLEKSRTYGLTTAHQRLVTTLDELFPRLTLEQLLENRGTNAAPTPVAPLGQDGHLADRVGATITDRLAPSVSALTSAVQTFAQRAQRESSVGQPRAIGDIAKGVRDGLATPMQDLQRAIAELTQSVGSFRHAQERTQLQLDELAGRLTVDLRHLGDVLERDESQHIGAGFRWLANLRQRATVKGAA
ncbi:hypothetical protein YTPLAS18_33630 [Nitrospira sp.]|nr:hypothetical protein YTPLAS18_33630 [Nitrospira sp.]